MSPSSHHATSPATQATQNQSTRKASGSAADSRRPEAPVTRRLRYTPTVFVPLAVGAICAMPVAIALGPWGLLLAIPVIIIAVMLRRIGLDIEADAVRVRGAFSSVTIPRQTLAGFTLNKSHVYLTRTDGSTVRIPTVRPRDLPMLRESLFPSDTSQPPER